ncbi:MAG: Hsp70 family protein [Lachnospiraceae bacterium]|nr:Hsp70 family protein [Lachnospiraceae bacterium]
MAIIGIDLGTTNSLLTVFEDGESKLIPNEFGDFLTPSVVNIEKDGGYTVGNKAKECLITDPLHTFASFKRNMGSDVTYKAYGKEYTPVFLSACVLKSLKLDAERYLGEVIYEAVISVPAYFDDKARSATKKAGAMAGLKVERILNEPSAAALAYVFHEEKKELLVEKYHLDPNEDEDEYGEEDEFDEKRMLIFDFGGGTLDISVVDHFGTVVEIIAVSGDNKLGGIDFDRAITDHFLKINGIEENKLSAEEYNSVVAISESTKRILTDELKTVMKVTLKGKEYEMAIERKDLITICADVFKRISAPLKRVLVDSATSKYNLGAIVLVGGSSKMPVVQQYLMHLLDCENISVTNPDHMVALGVGQYVGIKERQSEVKDYVLTDVCPFSLGTGVHNKLDESRNLSSVIIPRNSALPISKTEIYHPVRADQDKVSFKIYQGEEMYADMNKKIDELEIRLGKAPSGKDLTEVAIYVTYTYDINGILLVDIEVPDMHIKKHKQIKKGDLELSDADSKRITDVLNSIKKPVAEKNAEDEIFKRGEELFAIAPDYLKYDIGEKLNYYAHIIRLDMYRAPMIKKRLEKYLDDLEAKLNVGEDDFALDDTSWYSDNYTSPDKVEEDWERTWENKRRIGF